jgi:TM2 domain-containing membrane protein YozV
MTYCTSCGAEIAPSVNACPRCGIVATRQQPIVVIRDRKEPWFALALSFLFSGLGQIYNGEIGKGIAFIIAHAISIGLMWIVVGFITTPIIWIWSMIDAYKSAQRFNLAHGTA